jgi:esterase/lipase superfamily enzyme
MRGASLLARLIPILFVFAFAGCQLDRREGSSTQPSASAPAPPPLPPGIKGYREVFYATDRVASADGTFGGEPSDNAQLQYGRVVISIPDSHSRGELERPWRILSVTLPEDARRHIVIANRGSMDKDTFFRELTGSIDAAPESGAFVFVHGFNVSFDDAVLRTGQLAWDMKFRGPALTYSWPSAAATSRYVSDLDMADWTAPHLAAFLQDLRKTTGARTIHLVAHSMGSRVLTMALERVALVDPATLTHFQEVVLAAPDINNRVLLQLSTAVKTEADRVTIYASNRDRALRASAFLRRGQGRAGSDASAMKLAKGYDIIDATRAKSSLLGHSYFAEDTTLLNDLALLLKQRLGPDQRSITLEQAGPIWVFRP